VRPRAAAILDTGRLLPCVAPSTPAWMTHAIRGTGPAVPMLTRALRRGPMEAVEDFLKENDAFAVDVTREKLLLTFNPAGLAQEAALPPGEH
jgi:hypothetical protein